MTQPVAPPTVVQQRDAVVAAVRARPLADLAAALDSGACRLELSDTGSGPVLTLHGEADLAAALLLRPVLDRLLTRERLDLVVDVTGLTFVDCSGLAPLLRAERSAALLGGQVRLRGSSAALDRLLACLDLSSVPRTPMVAV